MNTQAILIKDLMPAKVNTLEFRPVCQTAEHKAEAMSDESKDRCCNGLCRVTWKPNRSAAA